MAWSTTDIVSNDIILQDGTLAYNFVASGAIEKGQAVTLCGDNKVMPTDSTHPDAIGFATMPAIANQQIGIACAGNIIICCMDDNASVVGTALYGDTDGALDETQGTATKIAAYLVDNSPIGVSGTTSATYHVITAYVV